MYELVVLVRSAWLW